MFVVFVLLCSFYLLSSSEIQEIRMDGYEVMMRFNRMNESSNEHGVKFLNQVVSWIYVLREDHFRCFVKLSLYVHGWDTS